MTEITDRIGNESATRFRPYAEYRDSGVEWLGEIPAHWATTALKRPFRVVNGSTPSSGEPDNWDGDIPWVTPEDLGRMKGRVLQEPARYLTPRGYESCGTRMVRAGSLILSTRAPIGHLALAGTAICTNQGCRSLVLRHTDDETYFYFQLRAARPVLEAAGRGSTFKELASDDLGSVDLAVPPPHEQRAIAAFLDRETAKIDALVARKERLIELLQEKRNALITRAVTRGLDPTVPMKDSGVEWLGEIPAHWDVKRVKWVARMESGHTPDKKVDAYWTNGEIPWVSLNDTRQLKVHDYIRDTEYTTNELGLKNSSARLLPPRSVVFSRDATIGLCAITERAMAVSQHFIAWICNENVIPEYLLRVFDATQGELERLTMGATLRTIGMPEVNTLATPVPPVDEQEMIVNHIHQERAHLELLIAKVHEAADHLKELRTALISAAVTGKIDVREAVPR